MVLTTFMLPAGYPKDSWRMEGSRAEELGNLDFVADLTAMAEAAKLDAVFFGDIVHANTVMRGDIKMNGFYEPMTVLAALAARTKNIGLIGTMSTSFSEPYNLARQLCGLDHMSNGRAGWNIVTSSDGFSNYGVEDVPDPAVRYRRATEFVDVVQRLWDSWSDDAIIVDRASGEHVDRSKLIGHPAQGEFFEVEGPINMPRSPQGRPCWSRPDLGPAWTWGSSVGGRDLHCPAVQGTVHRVLHKFKNMVAEKGRNPDDVKIILGILPILGDTEKEAQDLANELASYVALGNGRKQVGADLKMDLSELEFDETIPVEWFSDDPRMGSRYQIYRKKSVDMGMTLRELIVDLARSTGHQWMAGTPSQVADRMVDWFESKACDGFNLNAPFNPGGFKLICDKLVPELQDRGYFRSEYEGTTLRDNLGLSRPTA
jgi:FMN-dependent oxidoreductase (nitrilotriacetate monooxygenase family)